MHLYENKEVFNQLIVATSQVKHLPEAVVEKDYYVSLLLRRLRDELPNLVFKGGTSLSKAYHVIQPLVENFAHYTLYRFKSEPSRTIFMRIWS
ncbi:nucleotidyl transferase AbiEii/AbiGii toxin family protein [Listeria booriae]|uniref:Nucleotidyl transferase AbiEii/AbiGii toxin family protein n=1 Tax=Listeria booriae TaxID=1552123 RepID=A0A7X1CCE0_9LIST|nr:nucleotidyl transferase AbiEii/AbiGii toxin family protein [Listeria booriae]MBC1492348.1 nucleotidyl transferase AbiEii/AbiGii toxin family protein [Listeria booriae]MBC1504269.1 nucleotidyl transferase AbiEii/AbiGii toxin family protein [Listeria booriae]MBC1525542.1 nucleotidyl transferase AbiEii/AbiGii toxin family protein [Listeria booriae]MBC1530091.1 nucleotidyl transferase AbiEii/AbiGii toxin family protein [Listeria booriae]MBC6136075.1 nucleotidyl transferase AbiEii/AbiGii toxin f